MTDWKVESNPRRDYNLFLLIILVVLFELSFKCLFNRQEHVSTQKCDSENLKLEFLIIEILYTHLLK